MGCEQSCDAKVSPKQRDAQRDGKRASCPRGAAGTNGAPVAEYASVTELPLSPDARPPCAAGGGAPPLPPPDASAAACAVLGTFGARDDAQVVSARSFRDDVRRLARRRAPGDAGAPGFDAGPGRPLLPPQRAEHRGRVTVVVDLDETVMNARGAGQCASVHQMVLRARPHLRPLLDLLHQHCEVVVWTAGLEAYAQAALRRLDPLGRVHHCISRHAKWAPDPTVVYSKDLALLGRDMDKVLLIDNTPECVRSNSDNAVVVRDYVGAGGVDNTLPTVASLIVDLLASGLPVPRFLDAAASDTGRLRRVELAGHGGAAVPCYAVAPPGGGSGGDAAEVALLDGGEQLWAAVRVPAGARGRPACTVRRAAHGRGYQLAVAGAAGERTVDFASFLPDVPSARAQWNEAEGLVVFTVRRRPGTSPLGDAACGEDVLGVVRSGMWVDGWAAEHERRAALSSAGGSPGLTPHSDAGATATESTPSRASSLLSTTIDCRRSSASTESTVSNASSDNNT